tara:strand:- start:1269 stop:2009 length:741 start_codon:yes stop_codon:yes gene_type:complete
MDREALKAHKEEEHGISAFATYIKEIVYGGTDGIITTFAVVSGFSGANLGTQALNFSILTVLIFGLANLIADGASMGLGNFLSLRSEKKVYDDFYDKELHETKVSLEYEIEETEELLVEQGFDEKDANTITKIFAKNTDYWVKFMVQYEGGLGKPSETPIKSGLITFFSFLSFGFIPLIPYILMNTNSFLSLFITSIIATIIALFILGLVRAFVSKSSYIISIMETVSLGAIASLLAYLVGYIFTL